MALETAAAAEETQSQVCTTGMQLVEPQVHELVQQVRQLMEDVSKLQERGLEANCEPAQWGHRRRQPTCWECGVPEDIQRECLDF